MFSCNFEVLQNLSQKLKWPKKDTNCRKISCLGFVGEERFCDCSCHRYCDLKRGNLSMKKVGGVIANIDIGQLQSGEKRCLEMRAVLH